MTDANLSRRLAEDLLDIKAVTFSPDEPFTWASGLKSPVYCDNRLTISYPKIRKRICEGFRRIVEADRLRPDVIVGTATAGIPHAAWLADALDLPLAYVRSKPKTHGRGSQIEGRIHVGHRALVVEDLISTGGSSTTVVRALRQAGAHVGCVLAIFSYELRESREVFDEMRIPLHTLTRFEELFEAASARSVLSAGEIRSIKEWRADPQAWSAQRD